MRRGGRHVFKEQTQLSNLRDDYNSLGKRQQKPALQSAQEKKITQERLPQRTIKTGQMFGFVNSGEIIDEVLIPNTWKKVPLASII